MHQILLTEHCQTVEDAGVRLDRLNKLIVETSASWSVAPVAAAYQAMRGVAFMTAVTLVVEIGDVRRFDSPRQLMAYLGLVPTESSTGERVRRGGITKARNARARRALIEGPWTYRYPARISPTISARSASGFGTTTVPPLPGARIFQQRPTGTILPSARDPPRSTGGTVRPGWL